MLFRRQRRKQSADPGNNRGKWGWRLALWQNWKEVVEVQKHFNVRTVWVFLVDWIWDVRERYQL